MQVQYKSLSPNSRVWIYQADRALSDAEAALADEALNRFTEGWAAHGSPIHGYARSRHNLFLIFFADIDASQVSGCSIDASVQLVRELGQQLGIDFFNRMNLVCELNDGSYRIINRSELRSAVENNTINGQSLVFDNLVQTKADFESAWKKPVSATWAATALPQGSGTNG